MKLCRQGCIGNRIGLIGLVAILLAPASHAEAPLGERPSAAELAGLPEYCKARLQDAHSPEYQAWAERLGHKFLGMHHYCFGLNYINRYFTTSSPRWRGYYLSRVLPEMDYVMKDMPDTFPLAGEMYLNHGDARSLMGNKAAALADYSKAMEIDPRQPQPYYRLIEYYAEAKNRAKALDVASKGLTHIPDSALLQKKYLQLGGKKPFPVPVNPDDSSQDAAPTSNKNATPSNASTKSDNAIVSGKAPQSAPDMAGKDSKANDPDSGASKPSPIGEPGNPYCRFCP